MHGLYHIMDVIKKLYNAPYESFSKILKSTKRMWNEEWKVIR